MLAAAAAAAVGGLQRVLTVRDRTAFPGTGAARAMMAASANESGRNCAMTNACTFKPRAPQSTPMASHNVITHTEKQSAFAILHLAGTATRRRSAQRAVRPQNNHPNCGSALQSR